jgi:hypothetical protein
MHDPTGLQVAAQRKRDATLTRATAALTELADEGAQISFQSVARLARVSRQWLYAQPALRRQIEQLRERRRVCPPANAQAERRCNSDCAACSTTTERYARKSTRSSTSSRSPTASSATPTAANHAHAAAAREPAAGNRRGRRGAWAERGTGRHVRGDETACSLCSRRGPDRRAPSIRPSGRPDAGPRARR